jgi:hypothetical protein
MRRKYKRTKKLVDRPVQIAVVTRFLVHVGVFAVVGSLITIVSLYLANPFQSGASLLNSFWQQAGPFLVVLLAMLPIFVWDSIKLTNRIVGPMVRLRATLRQFNAGEEVRLPLRFREGDFWHDLADEVNRLVQRSQEQNGPLPTNDAEKSDHTPEAATV